MEKFTNNRTSKLVTSLLRRIVFQEKSTTAILMKRGIRAARGLIGHKRTYRWSMKFKTKSNISKDNLSFKIEAYLL